MDNWNILQQYNWNNFAWLFLFLQWKRKRGCGDLYHDIEIPRPKNHDIEILRPKNCNIEIPRQFFRGQKAAISRFQDQKATTSSFCGILTLMPPDTFDTWYLVTCATRCVSFYQNRKQLMFFQTYSEIESTWWINSSKQETVLSRDSKELFVQRFVKVFDQNWKHVEAQNQRTGNPSYFTVPG